MKTLPLFTLLLMLSGCQHQAPRVACDRHLVPINATTPVVKELSATSAPTP